jgi:pimeloyl-ACP methyl ester carboxylesterase
LIYFIHGYLSSPTGIKATLFNKTIHAIPITYQNGNPEDLVISDCLKRISTAIQQDPSVVLIGSSLGGFLAASTALTHPNVTRLIVLNPAIIPPHTDLHTITGMPIRILQEMKDPRLFEEKIHAPITIIRGTQDEIVPDDWVLTFAEAQQATIQLLNDDHQFSKNLQKLPALISEILKQ